MRKPAPCPEPGNTIGGSQLVTVTFYGVRGSTPCSNDAMRRYGGNTACVVLESPGIDPIVFDLGTGLRFWGATLADDGSFRGTALVTHLHWDHVQGLPFFTPIDRLGARLDVYGPKGEESLGDAFAEFVRPPYFPVRTDELRGEITFHDLTSADVEIPGALVRARSVPHVGATNGYRVEVDGVSVAYVSDHQQPRDAGDQVPEEVVELCRGVDLLIHDAQFTGDEFAEKPHWGHCTVDFAVHVAAVAGAKRLALFHHDPAHDDGFLDELLRHAGELARGTAIAEVIAASEGLAIALTPPST